jgi:type II secretory pathway pseudopilin PulG
MKHKNSTKQKSSQSGFTLVETLIGITILLVSVITPLSVASYAITYSNNARDEVVATNLAQEAIEFVRNERDRSFMAVSSPAPARMQNFLNKFGNYGTGTETVCFTSSTGCGLDVRQTLITNAVRNCATAGECGVLWVNNKTQTATPPTYTFTQENLRSGYDATLANWTATPFVRVVKMKVIGDRAAPTEMEINVTVTWKSGPYTKSINMKKHPSSWADGFIN